MVPDQVSISSIYPNPFNVNSAIRVESEIETFARIAIFDILGNQVYAVFEGMLYPGDNTFDIDGTDMTSGAYFIRLRGVGFNETRKITLLK